MYYQPCLRHGCRGLTLAVSLLAVSRLAFANGELATPVGDAVTPIYGGEPTATCGYPTIVSMENNCTGTLVHPEVVVYAAHCGAEYTEVWFGEVALNPSRKVPTKFCRTHPPPSIGAGKDIAACVLAEPVEDVPIIPILMGCEVDALQPGRKSTLVGYGFTEDDVYGVKHEVTTIIEGFADNNEILLGGDGKDACNGDSGGPGLIRLDPDTFPGGDGSWRVFGITSYGKSCGGSTYYSMIHPNIEWLEQATGIDVTPCHDTDGTWNPTALCGNVPLAPEQSVSTWNAGCSGGELSGWQATCGEPFPAPEDTEPPLTMVTAPGDGSVFEVEGDTAKIYVRIDSDDQDGWGLKQHTLMIDGQELPVHSPSSPLELGQVVFPHGTWELRAKATDYAGNSGLSEPITIVVGPPGVGTTGPMETGTTGDDSDTETTIDVDTLTSTGEGPTAGTTAGQDDGGCGCRSGAGQQLPEWSGLFGLLFLLPLRRRYRW